MSYGIAEHTFLEITAAQIIAASTTSWGAKVGSLTNCLALMAFNDLDQGFKIYFSSKQGESAPADTAAEKYKFAAGEPLFVNYKNIGHIFGACDVYIKKLASAPTTGSLRITGIPQAPLKFKG